MANRRGLDLKNLDAVMVEVDRLHRGGYVQAGRWDLAMICAHSAAPIRQSLDGFGFVAPFSVRLLVKLAGTRGRILRTRKIRAGLGAPPGLLPASGLDEQEQIEALRDAIGRFKAHDGPFRKHPFFGALSGGQWHDFLTIHSAHHLSFLVPAG